MVDVWDLIVINLASSELVFSSLASESGLIPLWISVYDGDRTIMVSTRALRWWTLSHQMPDTALSAGLTGFTNKAATNVLHYICRRL